jgi:transposase-like protein
MSQKIEFVERAMKPGARMSVLCREFGVSRETGYKWLNRFKREGADGLEERSRRPHASPLATAEEVVAAVLEVREAYPRRGPKKLVVLLERKLGKSAPSVATIARILKRFGMVRRKSRFSRPLSIVERRPELRAAACNEVWTVDFKGWWRARDGQRCEPLTVRDGFSTVRSRRCFGGMGFRPPFSVTTAIRSSTSRPAAASRVSRRGGSRWVFALCGRDPAVRKTTADTNACIETCAPTSRPSPRVRCSQSKERATDGDRSLIECARTKRWVARRRLRCTSRRSADHRGSRSSCTHPAGSSAP